MHPLLLAGNGYRVDKAWYDQELEQDRPMVRQGALYKRAVRAACGPCNYGFMSKIETTVQPVLSRLIQGIRTKVSEQDRQALIRWITMKMMVYQYADRAVLTHTTAQSRSFYETMQIPIGLSIDLLATKVPKYQVSAMRATNFFAAGDRTGESITSFVLGIGNVLFLANQGPPSGGPSAIFESDCALRLWPEFTVREWPVAWWSEADVEEMVRVLKLQPDPDAPETRSE